MEDTHIWIAFIYLRVELLAIKEDNAQRRAGYSPLLASYSPSEGVIHKKRLGRGKSESAKRIFLKKIFFVICCRGGGRKPLVHGFTTRSR